MGKTRTFIAIEAGEGLRLRAAGLIDRLRPYAPGARWVSEENFHLTLLFLGELRDAEIAETCSQVDWVARANAPFTVRIKGVGAFPTPQRASTLWLGVDDGTQPLCRLQADLADALEEMTQRGENRNFVPHWTLARTGKRASGGHSPHLTDVLAGLSDYDAGEQTIEELVVYASELRPEGPEYYPLAHCPLGFSDR